MNQEIEKLIEWAKMAVEETRAQYGWDEDGTSTPSWLAELEAAVEAVEAAQ